MRNNLEKNYDDYVYEDDFYNDNFDEEEIDNPDEVVAEQADDLGSAVEMILVCEECNNQWDEMVDVDNSSVFCPKCGANKVAQS